MNCWHLSSHPKQATERFCRLRMSRHAPSQAGPPAFHGSHLRLVFFLHMLIWHLNFKNKFKYQAEGVLSDIL